MFIYDSSVLNYLPVKSKLRFVLIYMVGGTYGRDDFKRNYSSIRQQWFVDHLTSITRNMLNRDKLRYCKKNIFPANFAKFI